MTQYSYTPPDIDPSSTSGTALAAALSQRSTAENSSHQGNTSPTYAAEGMVWSGKNGRVCRKLSSGDCIIAHRPITSLADLRNFGEGQIDEDVVRVAIGDTLYHYYWDIDSEETDNDSTIILPSGWTNPGRWKRLAGTGSGGGGGWTEEEASTLYGSAEYFEVFGDKTDVYVENRALRLTQTSSGIGYVDTAVLDSAGNTIVQVKGIEVDAGLSKVEYGIEVGAQSFEDFSSLTASSTPADTNLIVSQTSLGAKVKTTILELFNLIKSKFGFDFDATTLTAGKTFQVVDVGGGVKKIQQVDLLPKTQITENTVFTVHQSDPSADYTDLATACYDVYNKYYPKAVANGITVEIKCLSGYIMSNPLHIRQGIDMGFIAITGEDTVVKINPTSWANGTTRAFYGILNTTLPSLQVRFDMEGKQNSASQNVDGLMVSYSSKASIADGSNSKGIINCSGRGVYAFVNSEVEINRTVVSSTTTDAVVAERGSKIFAGQTSATHGGSGVGYRVATGSIISTRNGTGFSGTVSQTVNTVTGSGIIFQ